MRNFELEDYFVKWEFSAKHHMAASDAESMTLPDLLAMASAEDLEAFEKQWLGYTETQGSPDLRAVIASLYDNLRPDNIQCFAGAQEGIYTAMRVMLHRDDHMIVMIVTVPNYQAAETVPLDICEVTGVSLHPDNDWQIDPDEFAHSSTWVS